MRVRNDILFLDALVIRRFRSVSAISKLYVWMLYYLAIHNFAPKKTPLLFVSISLDSGLRRNDNVNTLDRHGIRGMPRDDTQKK